MTLRRSIFTTLAVMVVLLWIGVPLTNPVARHGILSYEFAGGPERARAIVQSWRDGRVMERAWASFAVDMVFLGLYGGTIARMCREYLAWMPPRLAVFGEWLARAAVAAAGFDALENALLMAYMAWGEPAGGVRIATMAAEIKFALIGPPLLFGLLAGAWSWVGVRR